jgi:multidrug efflux pump subunit AcrB
MADLWTVERARERHPVLAFFARRPITVSVLLAATTVLGVISLGLMPFELWPSGLESRDLSVNVPYNRAGTTVSPLTVEREVTLPVEAELSTIPGLQNLVATSSSTGASFNLEFDNTRSMDDAYAEVFAAVERARLRLSDDVGQIRIRRSRADMGGMPMAFMNFSWADGTEDPHLKLERIITPHLESVEGVAGVSFWGAHTKFIAIDIDAEKTRAYGINLNELLQSLRGDNFRLPAGRVDVEEGTGPGTSRSRGVYLVADSRFRSLREIEETPVRPGLTVADITRHGSIGGVAHRGVYETLSVNRHVRVNRQSGASGSIQKVSDANTVQVSDRLHAAVAELNAMRELEGFNIRVGWSQGDSIKEGIATLFETLMYGGILAFIVLLLFLKSWRLSMVIALSIPLAMTLTIAVMYFYGETINLLALMGFTVAAGMLLDNSIVVAENIYRRHALGEPAEASAVRGAGEVGLALVLATSTTIIVFVTVVFVSVDDSIGFMMSRLGMPICISLAFSIILALGVIPMTMNRSGLLKRGQGSRLRRRFVYLRRRLSRRMAGAPKSRRAMLWPLLALWEIAAAFMGRNARGVPDAPVMDKLGRAYTWTLRRAMPARYLIGTAAVTVSVWGVYQVFGSLEQTDQNQGNRDRISMWIGFDSASDVMVSRRGLRVTDIEPGSLAERAGLLPDDFILRYADRRVDAPETLRMIEDALPPGVPTTLTVARGRLGGTFELPGGPLGVQGEMDDTQPVRDAVWQTYIFDVEDALLGNPHAAERRARAIEAGMPEALARALHGRTPEEAQAEFGIQTFSVSYSSGNARIWMHLHADRVHESNQLYRNIMAAMPERAGVRFRGGFDTGGDSAEVSVRLTGPDTERLLVLAEDAIVRLSDIPGLDGLRVDANDSLDQVTLGVDRMRAAAYGVEPATLSRVLGFQVAGTTLRDFQQGEHLIPLRVRFAPPEDAAGNPREAGLDDVQETRVPTAGGDTVPARAFVETTGLPGAGMADIRRQNRQTSVRIVGTTSSDDLQRIRQQVDQAMQGVNLPPGYNRELGGRFAAFGDMFKDLWKTLAWAALLVYLIMCFLFESFLRPVSILISSVPGALLGGLALLWLTGTPFDNITMLGMMVLVGVVVNNGIVLVDLINRLRAEGVRRSEAVLTACRQRMRPIVLTSMTTAFGLIPMAIGSASFVGTPYYPMGRMILGGILVSMVYTLVLLPLIYTIVDDIGVAVRGWLNTVFGRRPAGTSLEPAPAPASRN